MGHVVQALQEMIYRSYGIILPAAGRDVFPSWRYLERSRSLA